MMDSKQPRPNDQCILETLATGILSNVLDYLCINNLHRLVCTSKPKEGKQYIKKNKQKKNTIRKYFKSLSALAVAVLKNRVKNGHFLHVFIPLPVCQSNEVKSSRRKGVQYAIQACDLPNGYYCHHLVFSRNKEELSDLRLVICSEIKRHEDLIEEAAHGVGVCAYNVPYKKQLILHGFEHPKNKERYMGIRPIVNHFDALVDLAKKINNTSILGKRNALYCRRDLYIRCYTCSLRIPVDSLITIPVYSLMTDELSTRFGDFQFPRFDVSNYNMILRLLHPSFVNLGLFCIMNLKDISMARLSKDTDLDHNRLATVFKGFLEWEYVHICQSCLCYTHSIDCPSMREVLVSRGVDLHSAFDVLSKAAEFPSQLDNKMKFVVDRIKENLGVY